MTLPLKQYAITGGIACGKSTIAGWLPALGGIVLDADGVAHRLQQSDGAAVAPLAGLFGSELIAADGSIDRRRLGKIVFEQPQALLQLNEVMHPLIKSEIKKWLSAPKPGARFQAVLIPLLFEAGWERESWDAVIAVVAAESLQVERLMGRGFSAAEAAQRIGAQLSCSEKAARADFTIENNGSIENLRRNTEALFESLLGSGS